jgi:hypothetical protein
MIINPSRLTLVLWVPLFLLLGLSFGYANQNKEAVFKIVIERIEKAIVQAAELYEQGKIPKGKPFVVPIAEDFQLSFSAENFQGDAEKAFQVLDQLMAEQKKLKAKAQVPAPAPEAKETSLRNREQGRLGALMEAEQHTAKASPPPSEKIPLEYNIYKKYQQDRQARLQQEEMGIEADKQIILAERQAVAQEEQRKREREQQLQAQSGRWQEELDKQAKVSSQATLEWEKEHSFGAYAKRFLGMVVQTSVGAFTGGVLGTLGNNLANQAVGKLFPDASTNLVSQSMAAGTSAAITSSATGIGQAMGQGVGSAVSGQTPQY